MSLQDKLKQADSSEHSAGGSGFFKIKEGNNAVRILVEPEPFFKDFKKGICYTNCGYQGTAKFMTYVLDRGDNKIKLFEMPYIIFQNLVGLQTDEENTFADFPMPYDIKINAIGAGTKEVKYTVIPGRIISEVDSATIQEVLKKKSPSEFIEKMKADNIEKHKADGTWQEQQDRLAELGESLERDAGKFQSNQQDGEDDIDPSDIPF